MTANRTGGPDPLERLFLLAGRRKPADPKRTDQIEQLTHDRWQATLARRRVAQRRRRIQIFGGSLAAAASVIGAVMLVLQLMVEAPLVARVVSVFGTAETGARGHAMTHSAQTTSCMRAACWKQTMMLASLCSSQVDTVCALPQQPGFVSRQILSYWMPVVSISIRARTNRRRRSRFAHACNGEGTRHAIHGDAYR